MAAFIDEYMYFQAILCYIVYVYLLYVDDFYDF